METGTAKPPWWLAFYKMLAVAAAWHVVPAVGAVALAVSAYPDRSGQCVDCGYGGTAYLMIIAFAAVLVAGSALLSLILCAAIAFLRPVRAWLMGNLAGVSGIVLTAAVIWNLW